MSSQSGTESTPKWWFDYYSLDEEERSSDIRNCLLVVAALIAAVTFQAGVNPPGGVWQDTEEGHHHAGHAIYASQPTAFYVFLISNTLALSTSVHLLVSLTWKFHFRVEVWIATASMMLTYASAIFAVTPKDSSQFRYIFLSAWLPLGIRCLIQACNCFCKPNK